MNKSFVIAFAGVLAVIGVLIWAGFIATKGNHLAPTGSIGKVRVVKVSDDTAYMVIDFNVRNDSDRDMVVRTVESNIEDNEGATAPGNLVAATEAVRGFRAYKILGEQYNPVMKERDTIRAHQSVDRMVGILFDLPVETVESRKAVKLRIEDITGPVLELTK